MKNNKMCVVWGHKKIVTHRNAGKINWVYRAWARNGLESPLPLVYDMGQYNTNSEIIHLQGYFGNLKHSGTEISKRVKIIPPKHWKQAHIIPVVHCSLSIFFDAGKKLSK